MKTAADYLQNVRLFADLTPSQRERIAAVCSRRCHLGRKPLFYENDEGGQLYIIVRGGVKIFTTNEETGQETILALLAPGDIFGEMALFLGGKRSASAVTIAEHTELLILDQQSFQSLMRESFEMAFAIMQNLAARLKETNTHLKDVVENSSTARLAKLLLARGDEHSGKLCPPLSQSDIAAIIGTKRETVARNLERLEQRRCVRRNRGDLVITNRDTLKSVAKSG